MNYYLVARNRKDNTFTVLKLQETWYLGHEKGRPGIVTRANDLEAIDLVTTRFCSEQEMADRMAINGYILDSDVDIFIASKRQKDGNNYIKFEEVIYNPQGQKITDALRRVAQTSLVSDFKDDSFDLDIIYNDVISTAYMANDYLEMLLEGDTNVPCDFSEQLREIQKYEDIPFELKLNANFGASDYSTVRNIVESLNRLNRLGRSYKVDRIDCNSNFVASNLSKRLEVVPELAIEIDKDYVEGQMSLFSLLEPSANNKKKKNTIVVDEEEKLIPAKIKIDRNLEKDEKRREIYRVLRSLPTEAIYRERGTNEFKVNLALFPHYPVSEVEEKKLSTYLTGGLPKYCAMYMHNYRLLCEANRYGFASSSEVSEIQMDVEYDIRRIDNRLKSSKCLNMVYEWCMVMEGALKRDKAVSEGAKVVDDTDDKEKIYGKKQ